MRGLTVALKNKSYNCFFSIFFFNIDNRQKVEIPNILKGKLYVQC